MITAKVKFISVPVLFIVLVLQLSGCEQQEDLSSGYGTQEVQASVITNTIDTQSGLQDYVPELPENKNDNEPTADVYGGDQPTIILPETTEDIPEATLIDTPDETPEETDESTKFHNNEEYDVALRELIFLFGDDIIYGTPQTIVDKYGEPGKKVPRDGHEYQIEVVIGTWQFQQGFDISVAKMNDIPILENYIYLSPACDLKLSTGIGIGSSRDEVLVSYGEFGDTDTKSNMLMKCGDEFYILVDNNSVHSIYIGVGSFSFWPFYPYRDYSSYDAWRLASEAG